MRICLQIVTIYSRGGLTTTCKPYASLGASVYSSFTLVSQPQRIEIWFSEIDCLFVFQAAPKYRSVNRNRQNTASLFLPLCSTEPKTRCTTYDTVNYHLSGLQKNGLGPVTRFRWTRGIVSFPHSVWMLSLYWTKMASDPRLSVLILTLAFVKNVWWYLL